MKNLNNLKNTDVQNERKLFNSRHALGISLLLMAALALSSCAPTKAKQIAPSTSNPQPLCTEQATFKADDNSGFAITLPVKCGQSEYQGPDIIHITNSG